jgi:hypothetical protein
MRHITHTTSHSTQQESEESEGKKTTNKQNQYKTNNTKQTTQSKQPTKMQNTARTHECGGKCRSPSIRAPNTQKIQHAKRKTQNAKRKTHQPAYTSKQKTPAQKHTRDQHKITHTHTHTHQTVFAIPSAARSRSRRDDAAPTVIRERVPGRRPRPPAPRENCSDTPPRRRGGRRKKPQQLHRNSSFCRWRRSDACAARHAIRWRSRACLRC